LIGSSTAGTGVNEEIIITMPDNGLVDDSFYYRVEVRYYSGHSCSSWSLSFAGKNCS
jgi:hypothetical protein